MAIMQSIELITPAGNWQSLDIVVAAGADAVYLGGKNIICDCVQGLILVMKN